MAKEKKTSEKKQDRRSFRLDKISAMTAKAAAVATKRKWLFLVIIAAIAAYFFIFKV